MDLFHNLVNHIILQLMYLTPRKLNIFTIFKLPSAYLCGVRTKYVDTKTCVVTVRHRWINQNPFKSMFWAVQGMAAELSTGALVMSKIKASARPFSMLVTSNTATFTKKATGKITFICNDGNLIEKTLEKAIQTNEGQTITMTSIGKNEEGVEVSTFTFVWSIKVRI